MMGDPAKKPGPNFIDRAIAFVSPETGVRRAAARQVLHEFSARSDRPERRGYSGGQARNAASESPFKNRDRIKDMWDARDMVEYDWVGGTLARVILYALGELSAKSNTGEPAINSIYDDYLHAWCGDEEDEDGFFPCDVTGKHRLIKMAQLGMMGMFVDGDHGYIPVLRGEQLALQQIEADRIGSPLDAKISPYYFGGVTVDPEFGRPVSYRIFDRTYDGQYKNPREIEPANFIHLWDPERADQQRGVSFLRPILPDIRDIREWDEGEMIAGKTQTQWSAVVGTADPFQANGAAKWEGKTKDGTPTQSAQWGKILKLVEGEKFGMVAPPARPSGSFMGYLQYKLRRIAVCLDLSYGFVWDLSTLGGVTARIEVRHDERRIKYWQRLMVDRFLRRVRRMVLARGVALGHIPFHPRINQCDWHFGAHIVTDVGYEAQNDLAMVQAGIIPVETVAAKYDADPIETGRKNSAVVNALQQIAASTGVPIEMMAGGIWPTASQLLAAMNGAPPPPPEPGSLEAVGEKGAAQIVDLLQSVAEGRMERAAAIQSLVTIYGLPPAKAEAITPAEPKKPAAEAPEDDSGGQGE